MSEFEEIINKIADIRSLQEEQDENHEKLEKLKDELEGLEDDIKGLDRHLETGHRELQELIADATLASESEVVKPYRLSDFEFNR